AVRSAAAERLLPPSLVVRADRATAVAARPGKGQAGIVFSDGSVRELPVDASGTVVLPAGLPTGDHRLRRETPRDTAEAALIVAPARCPMPLTRPGWGWMVQLYAARSRRSWGMGDYADLATLATWSGDLGAAMLLVNPLHASAPVLPQTDSPYYPSSRRFRSPLYLRVEEIPEMAGLHAADRRRVAQLAATARAAAGGDRIDRDVVFRAKDEALALLASVPRGPRREADYVAWREAEEPGIGDFATFCALAERHGIPWQRWPPALRHPGTAAVTAARRELADRVAYHAWLQWLCDAQLAAVAEEATTAGMALGVIHDLAVGVDPGGADAWALQDDLATAVTVGAPPDGFNQQGQDWRLPPLLPQRLAATGYAPFRDMLRSVLRHAGGVRIDHVMGLWRLWWVPEGLPASAGTYVRYPAEELLGVIALEAERAGALVVGEDLGTVEDGVRATLGERGILSSRVLYFERTGDGPTAQRLPAAGYPVMALSSVGTHDLPTAAGWWADEDVRVRSKLGLFAATTTQPIEAERKAVERAEMLALLRGEGLVGDDPDDDELALAMHRFLARTPSLLVATGLGDALGDRRQPNMPGTTDEYPNWRLPLARWGAGGPEPVGVEDVVGDAGVLRVAAALADRPGTGAR
nr:4-alpha-glucanotransferase [Euzebyales bacterium]